MDAVTVRAILEAMGISAKSTIHGFELGADARLERGSGIAGRGNHWALVVRVGENRHQEQVGPRVGTRNALKKLLREWLAGPKEPGTRYARLHTTRFGSAYIWVR